MSVGVSFYGHSARIWDCHISDSVIITGGEDCTCRLWDMDGNQIMMFKEHVGRGIWRCLYDPATSLLVTAGFDSIIQVHQLPFLSEDSSDETLAYSNNKTENFSISVPNVSENLELMDSKSEYVRCLHFAQEDILYIATNKGFLYCANMSSSINIEWTLLAHIGEVPIICMDVIATYSSDNDKVVGDMIAIGDGKGNATVIRAVANASKPAVVLSLSWPAERERQLLGIHWCRSLGCSYVFSTDPRGSLKLWSLEHAENVNVSLVAVYSSSFGKRIICLDASMKDEILVCGDQHGNLVIFPLLKNMLLSDYGPSKRRISSLSQFKGAHGISSVTSILIGRANAYQVEIRTTGGDGCICYLNFSRTSQTIEFCGMKHIKELTIIKNVVDNSSAAEDWGQGYLVIGFAFTDFFIWNLMSNSKVLQVPCGGWRRPYSYYLGHSPETQNCFAFLKDNKIHVWRQWEMGSERKSFPKILHMQCHGREIHSTCFLSLPTGSKDGLCKDLWVASGSEDGSVRLTRYAPSDLESWSASQLLGEHVGGSAVRSMCFVSSIYPCGSAFMHDDSDLDNPSPDKEKNWYMLVSVGAKQVLTSWLIRNGETSRVDKSRANMSAAGDHSSVSFEWLATHIPRKNRSSRVITDNGVDPLTSPSSPPLSKLTLSDRLILPTEDDNDWRYLAVTAFLVEDAEIRVCFVVVACSDATLTLRALLLPHRLWFDVALLAPQTSPVLSLQHVAVPLASNRSCETSERNAHIVISGSTDGNIVMWDLTRIMEQFMQSTREMQLEKLSKSQQRPPTGRGSCGGRWWRSSDRMNPKSKHEGSPKEERSIDGREALPLCVLGSVHQSGVNCLHASLLTQRGKESAFCVLSGGDDQAVSCLFFGVTEGISTIDSVGGQHMGSLVNGCVLRLLHRCKVESAHSAAVKGIWSDGWWVFSTGLDQRIRVWRIDGCEQLTEHAHLIISVPEPESVDVLPSSRSGDPYHIVVAGRGMQMIEFSLMHVDRAVVV